MNKDFVYVNTKKYLTDGFAFTNYDDLKNKIYSKISSNNFKKYNYVVVKTNYMCDDTNYKPVS